ncbi:MAG TPA: hypothetical protein VK636_00485 [Gemmatimonadaceae bacterium]|nr:hypothetical protein [Gemmatimonadaceae bacterium]
MLTPLVDMLRCVNPHADTWLVASIDRAEDRDILLGTLGCPTCLAEYPIRDGVVLFSERVVRTPLGTPREEDAIRLAAALDLTEPSMTAVLHGEWGSHAPIIRGISPAQLLLVNPPDGIVTGDGISIVVAETAPVAYGSAHAVAVDATASPDMITSLVACLRSGGRMLGPVALEMPTSLTELARDDEVWVARLDATPTSAPILPTRRPRPQG